MKDLLRFYFNRLIKKGFLFDAILKDLEESQYYSAEQLEEMQNDRLRKMVLHCYKNVPYYTQLFDRLHLKPESIKTKQDLTKLPFLDKKTVQENWPRFIAKDRSTCFSSVAYTSGSTGTPAKFLRNYYSLNFENAALWRQWRYVGDLGLKRITLRGDIIVPVSQSRPPFWKYNRLEKELLMSGYHLSETNAQAYIDKILSFKPEILYAYPSTANLLAGFFDNKNISYGFKAIFTSSESLSPAQKEHIEKVFSARIYDWYGQAERVVGIGQCEKGAYHIHEDYSIVELLAGNDGYEPVGTSLTNYLMPLIRYKTGDTIIPGDEKCVCGRNFRIVREIVGRNGDYIVSPEGAKITICNHIPRGVQHIREIQFYQEIQGEVIIKVVPTQGFSENDKKQLVKNTLEHTSPHMKVEIQLTPEIPREANGKFKSVKNKLCA